MNRNERSPWANRFLSMPTDFQLAWSTIRHHTHNSFFSLAKNKLKKRNVQLHLRGNPLGKSLRVCLRRYLLKKTLFYSFLEKNALLSYYSQVTRNDTEQRVMVVCLRLLRYIALVLQNFMNVQTQHMPSMIIIIHNTATFFSTLCFC